MFSTTRSTAGITEPTVAGVNERDRGGHAIPATRSIHGFRTVIAADGKKALEFKRTRDDGTTVTYQLCTGVCGEEDVVSYGKLRLKGANLQTRADFEEMVHALFQAIKGMEVTNSLKENIQTRDRALKAAYKMLRGIPVRIQEGAEWVSFLCGPGSSAEGNLQITSFCFNKLKGPVEREPYRNLGALFDVPPPGSESRLSLQQFEKFKLTLPRVNGAVRREALLGFLEQHRGEFGGLPVADAETIATVFTQSGLQQQAQEITECSTPVGLSQEVYTGLPDVGVIAAYVAVAKQLGGIRKIALPARIACSDQLVLVSEDSDPTDLLKRIQAGHREIGPDPLTVSDLVREVKYLCRAEIPNLEQHSSHPQAGSVIREAINAMSAFLELKVVEVNELKALAVRLDKIKMRFEKEVPSRFDISKDVIAFIQPKRDAAARKHALEQAFAEIVDRAKICERLLFPVDRIVENLRLIERRVYLPSARADDTRYRSLQAAKEREQRLPKVMSLRRSFEEYCSLMETLAHKAQENRWPSRVLQPLLLSSSHARRHFESVGGIVSRDFMKEQYLKLSRADDALRAAAQSESEVAKGTHEQPDNPSLKMAARLLVAAHNRVINEAAVGGDVLGDIKDMLNTGTAQIVKRLEGEQFLTRIGARVTEIARSFNFAERARSFTSKGTRFPFTPEGLKQAHARDQGLSSEEKGALLRDMQEMIVAAIADGRISLASRRSFSDAFRACVGTIPAARRRPLGINQNVRKRIKP